MIDNKFLEEFDQVIKGKSFGVLSILRSIINSEWTKKEEEFCAKLNIGDIVEYKKDNKNYIGVVSEIINKTIRVTDKQKNTWGLESSEVIQIINI